MKNVDLLVNNGVNIQKSLELFGDMETYDDTLETFLEEVDEKVEKLKLFKEQSDMANYAIVVHSLKSDAKYFGFEELARLAYEHEMKSKANDFYYVIDQYDELIDELNRILHLVGEYLGESVHDMAGGTPSNKEFDKTILVVDDSNIIRTFIQNVFFDKFEVKIANDGAEALNIINNDNGKIVAMLLDLNMPNVDGFAVLEYFKANDLFKKIPVSIITGEVQKETLERAFTYPIVDVLAKPFNEVNVKNILEKTIAISNFR